MSSWVQETIHPSLYSVFCGANIDATLGEIVSLAMIYLANICICMHVSTHCPSSQSCGARDTKGYLPAPPCTALLAALYGSVVH